MAKNEGRYVPDFFTMKGQLEAEIKALSKYVIITFSYTDIL